LLCFQIGFKHELAGGGLFAKVAEMPIPTRTMMTSKDFNKTGGGNLDGLITFNPH